MDEEAPKLFDVDATFLTMDGLLGQRTFQVHLTKLLWFQPPVPRGRFAHDSS